MDMATGTVAADLSRLGNLEGEYRHEWRTATPGEPLVVAGGVFKWSVVHRDGVPVPIALDAEARQLVAAAAVAEGWNLEYGLNFALLHVSTRQAFLIVGVWRGVQELWGRIYARELTQNGRFGRMPTGGEDAPVGCVWELGVVCHERLAWHRYLFSTRTEADKRVWLDDRYAGRV